MKKTLTFLAVAMIAMSAHGATIEWTLSNIAFGGSKLTSAGTELVASLFYLGSGGTPPRPEPIRNPPIPAPSILLKERMRMGMFSACS